MLVNHIGHLGMRANKNQRTSPVQQRNRRSAQGIGKLVFASEAAALSATQRPCSGGDDLFGSKQK